MTRTLTSWLVGLVVALAFAHPVEARTDAKRGADARSTAKARPAAAANRATPRKAQAPRAQRGSSARLRPVAAAMAEPPRLSMGQQLGLHAAADPLDLKSSVALVVDEDTNEVLFSKNPTAVLPIASITKLMTALLVVERNQPLDEILTVTQEDIDTEKNSPSRLAVGTELTRGEMLHLALMSSENRAANALGRHYPGGLPALVSAMNRRAAELGMVDTRYVEPTGLSSQNQSSARDLAALVKAAHRVPLLRELSTSHEAQVQVGRRLMQFRNTNGLISHPEWEIGLQKTGYISEAGRCVVMQARLAGRKLIMVLLDSAGKYSRFGDAERIRRWLDGGATAEATGRVVTPARRRAS